jgi:hypothetical protein
MPNEVLTGAQAIVRSLELLGIDTIFGLPGGAILPTYDPLMDSKKIRHIWFATNKVPVTLPKATPRHQENLAFVLLPLALGPQT